MRVPYCFFPENMVRRGSSLFYWLAEFIRKSNPELELQLKRANIKTGTSTYLAAALFSDFLLLIFIFIFVMMILLKYKTGSSFLIAILISFAVIGFVFFQQMTYPRAIINKKVRSIEKHLLSALRTMQIQISSGIPLYNVISSISHEEYGGVSDQFKKAVRDINSGINQANALEDIASDNPSIYFQRTLWQMVTAIKSGSDLSNVLDEMIQSLSEEQIVQVQDYGSRLNPLTMFYMLLVVVVPALALTFFVVLGSFLSINATTLKVMFWGMYGTVILFQLFFLSMISSRRPNLI